MKILRLTPVYLKYIKNPNTDRKVLQRKKYFLQDINKPRRYKNKNVIYAKQNNPDDCRIKFMFGSEKYHSTMNIDMNRVRRSHWLFSVLDYLDNTIPDEYDSKISFYNLVDNREKIVIKFEKEIYTIIIKHINNNTVMVITAYPEIINK